MFDFASHLALGAAEALSPTNLFFCFVGTLFGTMVGVLPGLGPIATIAMLLPITFYLPADAAIIMLAGIYYGSQYGSSTTAILMRIPGEPSSVVTAIDGYQMAQAGRAGAALAVAAVSSLAAGIIATVVVAVFAPTLSLLVLKFGPVEYFSLIVVGLVSAVVLASGSVVKAMCMLLVGLILGMAGTDTVSGTMRFTFGVPELYEGVSFAVVAMGVFGIAEVLLNLERGGAGTGSVPRVGSLWPSRAERRSAAPAALRGSAVGSILGVLPGGGAILASFASYMLEKKLSADPSRFGKGAIEGVAGPEAANNAGAQTAFIPMLTLGLPSTAGMALMIGALTIQGIQPGPRVLVEQPTLFWTIVVSMLTANFFLVILNLPLIGIWVRFLSIPYRLLYPGIILICCIGVYSLERQAIDVAFAGAFAAIGYAMAKLDCEPAPLLFGMILSPMLEQNFRRAMLLSHGDASVFVTQPISLILLLAAALLIAMMLLPNLRKGRDKAFQE